MTITIRAPVSVDPQVPLSTATATAAGGPLLCWASAKPSPAATAATAASWTRNSPLEALCVLSIHENSPGWVSVAATIGATRGRRQTRCRRNFTSNFAAHGAAAHEEILKKV